MNEALAGQENSSATYIDDVFLDKWEDHLRHVRAVLVALKCTGMTANPDKCTWGAQILTYLGHRVGRGLVEEPEARIAGPFWGPWATIAPLSLILLVGRYPYIMPRKRRLPPNWRD